MVRISLTLAGSCCRKCCSSQPLQSVQLLSSPQIPPCSGPCPCGRAPPAYGPTPCSARQKKRRGVSRGEERRGEKRGHGLQAGLKTVRCCESWVLALGKLWTLRFIFSLLFLESALGVQLLFLLLLNVFFNFPELDVMSLCLICLPAQNWKIFTLRWYKTENSCIFSHLRGWNRENICHFCFKKVWN